LSLEAPLTDEPRRLRQRGRRMDGWRATGTQKLFYGACEMRTDAALLNVAGESASLTCGPGCELLMLQGACDGRVIRSATRRELPSNVHTPSTIKERDSLSPAINLSNRNGFE